MISAAVKTVSRPGAAWLLTWAAPATLFALIAWGTLAPQDPLPKYFYGQDKFEHVAAFLLLGASLSFTASRSAIWAIVGVCLALAMALELGQAMFTLHRQPSLMDASAGMLGSLLGVAMAQLLRLFIASRHGLAAFFRP